MKTIPKIKKIDEGYRIYDDAFTGVRKYLKLWMVILREYSEYHDWDDVPFDYNERPNVGLFAAAIWRAKGVALEEFCSDKKDKNKVDFRGRVDLEFYISDYPYYTEFKHFYPCLTNGIGLGAKNSTNKKYADAKTDLAEAKVNGVNGLIGLFAVPYINTNQNENPTSQIREYLNWLADQKTPDVLAWWFPEEIRKRSNPGIILFLRRSKKVNL